MKARILLILVPGIISGAMGQNTIDLTFTAVNNGVYIQLDSIKVMNRTQGGSVMTYWPDTTVTYQMKPDDLLLFVGYAMDYHVGIGYVSKNVKEYQLFQSVPNPVRDQSLISLYLPSKGAVTMMISDINGRIVVNSDREFEEGTHSFRFSPGDEGIYFLSVLWNGNTQSIKIMTEAPTAGKTCKLEYTGLDHENPLLKHSRHKADDVVQQSGILDIPDHDTTYTFQFATNIPCPGTATVDYEGQVYNTIQIFSQCWLKENLNVGTMLNGGQNQTNNGIKEKYCYKNKPDSCSKYGGLYQWNEMMQYTTQQSTQGICPPGWHLPMDEEWKVLEGAVDSLYRFGDTEWDTNNFRGLNVATNLKTKDYWAALGNGTDLFGFSCVPGGSVTPSGIFDNVGYLGKYWTSTTIDSYNKWGRNIYCNYSEIYRKDQEKLDGLSVRCIRDY